MTGLPEGDAGLLAEPTTTPAAPPGPATAAPPGPAPGAPGAVADSLPRELRLHGVGGSPGATVLGFESINAAEVVAEGVDGSRFLARRDDETIEAYNYGDLTYGGGANALWVFLLPFTLLNAAGWMHPAQAAAGRLSRAAVHVLSAVLSVTYLFSAAIFLVDLVGYQWSRRLACSPTAVTCGAHTLLAQQAIGVTAGLVALLGVAVMLVFLAGRSQSRYEQVPPPPELRAQLRADAPWGAQERLDSPGFFWHPRSAKRLLQLHMAILGLAWLGVAGVTLYRIVGVSPPARLNLNPLVFWAGVPAALAVGLLWLPWLLSLPRALVRGKLPPASRAGPAIAASLSFGMVLAFSSGLYLLGAQRLGAWPSRPRLAPLSVGNAVSLVDVWGGALLGIALLIGMLALLMRLRPHNATADVPPRSAGPGRPLDGADPPMRRSIAFSRSLAFYVHHADWVALVLALGLYLTDVIASLVRNHTLTHFAEVPDHPNQIFYTVGAYGLTLLPVFVMQLVRKAQSGRTFVSTIWDVLTLLPRRFSPLAVRCYAERAVPEIQGQIDHQTRTHGRPVLVSAHSQGSVLAFCALASLPAECASKVALVTYGSPISSIYGRFFPEYFGDDAIAQLRSSLAPLEPQELRWRNFYRRTDPIGGPVFEDPALATLDVELPDPMATPAHPWPPFPGEAPMEHNRTPWIDIAGHSRYLCEPALKAWVLRVKAALASQHHQG